MSCLKKPNEPTCIECMHVFSLNMVRKGPSSANEHDSLRKSQLSLSPGENPPKEKGFRLMPICKWHTHSSTQTTTIILHGPYNNTPSKKITKRISIFLVFCPYSLNTTHATCLVLRFFFTIFIFFPSRLPSSHATQQPSSYIFWKPL